jgi:hypothetical protein
MKCVICGAGLTGGVDTFGEQHRPMCQDCYWDVQQLWIPPDDASLFTFRYNGILYQLRSPSDKFGVLLETP